MANRQAPMAKFTAELRAETAQFAQEHAAYAGQSLAAVLVGKSRKVESLKPVEVESFRKRYQVAKELVGSMLAAAKAAYSYEFYWANSHT